MKLSKKKFDITHAKVRELIDCGINPFSYYINNKKSRNLKWYLEYRSFLKYIEMISPDFKLLWCMSDFIKMLELLYMYHNVENATLYSILTKKSTTRSFRINFADFYIEYTLYEDDMMINCKVIRLWNKDSTSEITLRDGEGKLETRSDEILMYNIVNFTMSQIQSVFKEYYKKANEVKSNIKTIN